MDWKIEIETGPLAATLAPLVTSGDDGAITAILNKANIDAIRTVSRHVFVRWAAKSGMRATIQDVAVDSVSPLRSSALALLDIIQGGGDAGINFSYAENISMLNSWVSLNKLTAVQRDELLGLATVKVSRAEVVRGGPATIFEVSTSLRNNNGTRKV